MLRKIFEIILFKNGLWTVFAKVKFLIYGIKFGKNLKVYGPIFVRKLFNTNLEIGDNVTLLPNVEFKLIMNGEIIIKNNVQIDTCSRIVAARKKIILEENVHLGPFCIVNGGEEIIFGKNTITSSHCSFNSSEHTLSEKTDNFTDSYKYGKLIIGENCWIGSHVIVVPNVKIGKKCVIGAHSFVNNDLNENSIAYGIPAKANAN
jgi:acetyltransferase-like isoleucine patch superfamily enzyme